MATYQQLKTRAEQVRDEQTIGGNTALRVGQLLCDMVDKDEENADSIDNLSMYYAGTQNNPIIETLNNPQGLHWLQSPIVALVSMGEDLDGDAGAVVQEGDLYYYNHNGYQIFQKGNSSSLPGTGYKARKGVLFINKYTGKFYEWTGSIMTEITLAGTGGGGGGGGGGDITVDSSLSSSSRNPVQNRVITAALANKQDTLTFDNAPTANSNNVVRSGGIKQAIDEKLSQVTVNAIPAGSVAVIDGYYSDSATDVLSAGKGKDLNDRLTEVCGGVIYEDTEVTTEETTDVTLQEGLIRTPGVGQVCDMTVDSSINFVRCAVVNLDAGDKIEIKGVGGGAARLWAVVDKTTHVIQSMETNSSSGSPWPTNPWEKTIIAETDCIVVVNVYWDNANEPYGNTSHIPPTVKLTTYTTEIVPVGTPVGGILGGMQDDIEELQEAAEGPLKGKKLAALGDSITWGFIPRNTAGAEGQMDSFAKLTAERLGMDFVNAGIVGSSVTNITGRNPMCNRYADLPNDADVVVFMGGTNDIRNGAVLGTMADRGTDTFYGALHTIMQGLYTKYIGGVAAATGKKKKVIICTPIKLLDASKSSLANTVANNAGVLVEWDAWIDAIKEVAAFYSLPVCDMYNLSGINPHLDRTIHGTTTGYTGYYNPYITDGTHPTQEGAEMMADVFVGFLKTLK